MLLLMPSLQSTLLINLVTAARTHRKLIRGAALLRGTMVTKVLVLFVESGAVYCFVWVSAAPPTLKFSIIDASTERCCDSLGHIHLDLLCPRSNARYVGRTISYLKIRDLLDRLVFYHESLCGEFKP